MLEIEDDYLIVDGLEPVVLRRAATEVEIEHANRGNLSAGNQLSGMDVGSVTWLLPAAEFTGAIERPLPEDKIVAGNEAFVIVGVPVMNLSRMWICQTRVATIDES